MMPALGPAPGVLTIACLALALLAVGVALLALLSLIVPAARAIWPNLVAALIVAGAVLGVFLAGGWVLVLVLMAVAARIGWEAAITRLPPDASALALPIGAGAALAAGLAALVGPMPLLPVLGVVWLALLALSALPRRAGQGQAGGGTYRALLDLALFPLLPLLGFAAGAADVRVAQVVLVAFVLVETFDSYAMVAGRLAGRRLAFPRLSPRKTVEGLAGGAVMLALTAALAGPLLFAVSVWQAVLVATLAGLLAIGGDLAASRLKRWRGVKDYPRLMAHQGGLLDIADAWIAAGAGLALAVTLAGAALGGNGG